jgi:8-amino-7-oxononanoate synthase
MESLNRFASAKLAALEAAGLMRQLVPTDRGDAPFLVRAGKRLISFSCNDYLNLSHHPKVIEAAIAATRSQGVGAGASRLITGDHVLLEALESRLAAIKGSQDAVVFGSGFLANIGIIPTLLGPGDLILLDELAHACLMGGAALSRAEKMVFRHNDTDHLAELLALHRGNHKKVVIATETVFSMDGDLAPLARLAQLAQDYDAWLLCDDAHGLGVIGGGRGGVAAASLDADRVPLQMGTLSKAAGGYGGYLCASSTVCDLMRNRARSFVYTTGLPPGVVAAAIAALDVMASDPALCARPLNLAQRFCARLRLPAPQSPIVPLAVGDSRRAVEASAALAEKGFLAAPIRPPTVPESTARLRFAFSAALGEADIDAVADAVREAGLSP